MKNISFAGGSIESPVLERVLRKALDRVEPKTLLHYEDPRGLRDLRQYMAAIHAVSIDNVLIASSAHQSLSLAAQFVRPGLVLVQEPTYFGTWNILRRNGCIVHRLPAKPDPALDSCRAMFITSNFHNPTGVSLNIDDKKYLARLAHNEHTIVEDNPYDMLYYGEQPGTIYALEPQSTIYIGSFSKTLAPGLRLGYMIATPSTVDSLKELKKDADLFTSTLNQQVCLAALQQDYLPALRSDFKAKRDAALNALESQFKGDSRVSWTKPEGGIFIQVTLDGAIPAKSVRDVAKGLGLQLEPDEYAYADRKSRNTTRINFAQNPIPALEWGIRRFSQAVRIVSGD
ncbi:PLP-dependent aminotransferase family protein [Candidatus Woesearchaeota archaeon]|nr:PLP-dependent aminotransferase family protein [Candidatus Woesearchaeota archaeon]